MFLLILSLRTSSLRGGHDVIAPEADVMERVMRVLRATCSSQAQAEEVIDRPGSRGAILLR